MAKRTRTPAQTCPQCGTRIVYLLQGRRTRACDLERYAVITAQGHTAVGWRRHKCPQLPSPASGPDPEPVRVGEGK